MIKAGDATSRGGGQDENKHEPGENNTQDSCYGQSCHGAAFHGWPRFLAGLLKVKQGCLCLEVELVSCHTGKSITSLVGLKIAARSARSLHKRNSVGDICHRQIYLQTY